MKQKLIDTKEFMKKLTEEIDAVSSEDYDGEEMAKYDWASGWWISTKVINKVLESTTAIDAESVRYGKWIPCDERLPNEDEIIFNGVSITGEREISDRVLAIDLTGFIRCGYFTKAMIRHNYHGNGKRNIYSVYGEACWDFCEHYDSNPKKWIVPTPTDDIVAWMPLPKPWKGEES